MGSEKWTDERFGKRVKHERDLRGWSQAEMAQMLSDNGIQPIHPTTIAKIEGGTRSVRINEALGIANLFEASLDELLDRARYAFADDLALALGGLGREARQSAEQISEIRQALIYHLANIPDVNVNGLDALLENAEDALNHLDLAKGVLEGVARSSIDVQEPQ
jgi:transcriptional regulator with XRE-family HTH domain